MTATATTIGYISLYGGSTVSVFAGNIFNAVSEDIIPGAVNVYDDLFKFTHVTRNIGTEVVVGFKLDYTQIPCGSSFMAGAA